MTRMMHVLRLIVHARSRQPVLLLGESGGDRCVPVFLRPPQAEVIAAGRRDDSSTALTQDVLLPVVEALGHRCESVEISDLADGVYTAELVFDGGTRLGVKPSDALSIAVREGLPIGMAEHVLDEVGQPTEDVLPPDPTESTGSADSTDSTDSTESTGSADSGGIAAQARAATGGSAADPPEEQLAQFREFIDEVSPDDFR